jgi:hypothetical protein
MATKRFTRIQYDILTGLLGGSAGGRGGRKLVMTDLLFPKKNMYVVEGSRAQGPEGLRLSGLNEM